MCGIFGIIANEKSKLSPSDLKSVVNKLFKLSESRGKEAAGVAFLYKDSIDVLKAPVMASELINSSNYNELYKVKFDGHKTIDDSVAIVGHSRLVTNGTEDIYGNNQPVLRDGMACIHNGIIVNDKELWLKYPELKRYYDIDTEIILALVSKFLNENYSLGNSVKCTFNQISGATSVAILLNNSDEIALATNNGSLYICYNKNKDCLIFASEKYILDMLLTQVKLPSFEKDFTIANILPGTFYLVNIKEMTLNKFEFNDGLAAEKIQDSIESKINNKRKINEIRPEENLGKNGAGIIKNFSVYDSDAASKLLKIDTKAIDSMRRCSRCVLPETFPLIRFDQDGVCNVCNSYKKVQYKGAQALEEIVTPYRSEDGTPDCLMTFSGGRDSSYAVHYVKNVLKMNPLAYTYDWGMVTNIARRNISRICGKLGIEHILVSADIRAKRKNIRKNVLAWLKKPSLGTIPLFMAGDKQFFYYANKLQKQMDLKLLIFSFNPMEETNFKVGFCGINEIDADENINYYNLSIINKVKLFAYYGKEYLLNPSYLNSSVWDTLFAYFSYYMIPQKYLTLFDFIKWDEEEVNRTLIEEYDWEVAKDVKSTWRIGDGTAAFYNYIYYKVAGFTEFDTLRSNQIREGYITRDKALGDLNEINIPRGESIKWYCDTVGIDFESTIKRINSIPTLY
jgi:glutamine---fructose-6-phosphate transaminase (isomerizing)